MLVAHERKRKFRDPERTRERLLQAAFREVHRSGFQSASIDAILAATNVTKGALYYHFESKEALGYAVVEEKIAKLTRDRWLRPMCSEGEPIDILIGVVRRIPDGRQDVRAGCPLLLLAQEMSPLDEQFRERLERIFLAWQEGIATLLRKGKSQGTVRRDVNPDEAASFLIATGDDHISKSTFKTQCWDTQVDFIGHFDLERITTGAGDAFVKYLCHTKNGKSFRNVEYLRIKNERLESIECYFGAQSTFPSAVSTGQK